MSDSNLNTEIGNLVRTYRKMSGLTQRDLAKLAGVGKAVVFDIEKGKPTIQLNTLLKILGVLNIKIIFKKPIEINKENEDKEAA